MQWTVLRNPLRRQRSQGGRLARVEVLWIEAVNTDNNGGVAHSGGKYIHGSTLVSNIGVFTRDNRKGASLSWYSDSITHP